MACSASSVSSGGGASGLAGWDDETCGGGGGRGGGTGGVVVRGGGCMRPPYLELPVLPPEVPLRKRWEAAAGELLITMLQKRQDKITGLAITS